MFLKPKTTLQDPKIDLIRKPFLNHLSRLCLLVALGQFASVVPLYLMFDKALSQDSFRHYLVALTLGGILMMGISYLCRHLWMRNFLASGAFFILFFEATYFHQQSTEALHPLVLVFPLLIFLAPGSFGRGSSYVLGLMSFAEMSVAVYRFEALESSTLGTIGLIGILLLLTAYATEVLWAGIQTRLESLGILATGMAHELNTPLTSLTFLLQAAKLPEPIAQEFQSEIDRMASILRYFLGFAKPSPKERIQLNDLVVQTQPYINRLSKAKTSLSYQLSEEPIFLIAQPQELQQVLLNLVKNALDATEHQDQGQVCIRTVAHAETGSVIVEDNGIGIDLNERMKIFDPFHTTKSPDRGTGLGLYLANQIVSRHGGQIQIDPDYSKGTRIIVDLPRENRYRRAA